MNNNQEQLDKFQKENGMSLDEAWRHVRDWNLSGKKEEAIRGCEEIVKFFPDHEAKELLSGIKDGSGSEKKKTVLEKAGSVLADKITNAAESIKHKHEESQSAEENNAEKVAENDFEQKIIEAKEHVTTNDERLWGALSYAWILVLYPLLTKRHSVYIQFHARQGLILFLLLYVFRFIVGGLFAILGLGFVMWIIAILYLPFLFFMAYQGYNGKWIKLPGIWKLASKINL